MPTSSNAKRAGVEVKRGDIYLVNFDPTIGAEIQKTRPAVIVQYDISNRYSAVTIFAAIISQRPVARPLLF